MCDRMLAIWGSCDARDEKLSSLSCVYVFGSRKGDRNVKSAIFEDSEEVDVAGFDSHRGQGNLTGWR
ncbi:hypothetical protein RRG08_048038 [Elysia crispata]|uniref:Uncharacterized protein n=1 Tax=Elysia crispata TaxID=231223 RepID=A0AAE0Z2F4_9GAST|nr:hypothetical protein RRG08_048038 [Elysia crispata]